MKKAKNSERYLLLIGVFLILGLLCTSTATRAAVWNVGTVQNLQIALSASQNNGEDDIINLAAGFYDVSATGLTYEPAENFSLTIEGDGANITTLDGGLSSPILTTNNGAHNNASITIRNITFRRGKNNAIPGQSGLTVSTIASITIESCLFTRNSGGAAFINVFNGGAATLVNNIFSGNDSSGSTVFVQTLIGQMTVVNNTFIGNRSIQNNTSAVFLESLGGIDVIKVYNNIAWGEFATEATFKVISVQGDIALSLIHI